MNCAVGEEAAAWSPAAPWAVDCGHRGEAATAADFLRRRCPANTGVRRGGGGGGRRRPAAGAAPDGWSGAAGRGRYQGSHISSNKYGVTVGT